jgi:hypothetical protein
VDIRHLPNIICMKCPSKSLTITAVSCIKLTKWDYYNVKTNQMHICYDLISHSIFCMFGSLRPLISRHYCILYVHVCGISWVVNVWIHSSRSSLVDRWASSVPKLTLLLLALGTKLILLSIRLPLLCIHIFMTHYVWYTWTYYIIIPVFLQLSFWLWVFKAQNI